MAWSREDSEESIRLLINNVKNKFSIEFNNTPKEARQRAKRKSKITVRVNSKLSPLAAG
jgi:hypothetical protein